MKWPQAIVNETLRLYPPVWIFSRKNSQPLTLSNGMDLRAGTFIGISPYVVHRNPRLWSGKVDEFNPSRWLRKRDETEGNKDSLSSLIPFGQGKRRCVGSALAMFEAPLVLALMLRDHRVEIVEKDVHPDLLITLRPKNTLTARVTKNDQLVEVK